MANTHIQTHLIFKQFRDSILAMPTLVACVWGRCRRLLFWERNPAVVLTPPREACSRWLLRNQCLIFHFLCHFIYSSIFFSFSLPLGLPLFLTFFSHLCFSIQFDCFFFSSLIFLWLLITVTPLLRIFSPLCANQHISFSLQ